ncbi:ergothioneine biosynthesis glutamate--cysteine ligase EgtA, partial [Streptomyces sp. NPDC005047]
ALDALPRLGATTEVTDAVAGYLERYVRRGRCPADDLLDPPDGASRGPHGRETRS